MSRNFYTVDLCWYKINNEEKLGGCNMNLYLRKDGRFESRIPNGKKPDGKRAFLYVLARTKEHFLKYIKYSCVIFMQSDEKSVCAICIPDLISASLN